MQKSGFMLSRRRVVTAALLAVPLAGLSRFVGSDDSSVQAADVAVNILNFKFDPTPLTIPVGTTVVWTNQDTAPHSATSDTTGVFDTGILQKGQSGKITFNTPGTWTYFCIVHPNMHGTVTVMQAGGAPAPAPAPSAPLPPPPTPTAVPPTAAPPPAAPAAPSTNFVRRLGDG